MRRKLLRRICAFALILCVYPVCVIVFTWSHVLRSDLKGGRHGQLDAYRHALASATVSYTVGEWAVSLTTWIFESGGKDSNKMDIHNNRIGAKIGSSSKSFSELEPAVRQAVLDGEVSATDGTKITWLSPSNWRDGKFWQPICRQMKNVNKAVVATRTTVFVRLALEAPSPPCHAFDVRRHGTASRNWYSGWRGLEKTVLGTSFQ